MVWNVAGELVRPKNMTVGSNKHIVLNAALCSSLHEFVRYVPPTNIKFGVEVGVAQVEDEIRN